MPVGDRKLRVSLQLRLSVRSVCQLSGSISSCLEVKGQTPPLQNPATRFHGPVLIKDLRTSEVFNMFPLLFYLILFTLLYLHFISLTSDYSGLKFNAKDQKVQHQNVSNQLNLCCRVLTSSPMFPTTTFKHEKSTSFIKEFHLSL